jgi:hypothetical protein
METTMDSSALQELIAQIRDTKTTLAETEQKVSATKAELGQKDHGAQLAASSALLKNAEPTSTRGRHGWQPAG